MNVKERIQKYLDYMGIKSATFEREVGLSNGYWKKTKNISADILAAAATSRECCDQAATCHEDKE